MPEQRRDRSKTDPRLLEIARLVRVERTLAASFLLYIAAILLVFSLISFIPSPLHDYAQDLCQRAFGFVDSVFLVYGGFFFVLLIQVPLLGALAIFVRRRPSKGGQEDDGLAILRKQLLAEGYAPNELGISTEADWSRRLRLLAIACALLTCLACAVLYGIDKWRPVESPVRNINLNVNGSLNKSLLDGPVRMRATARLDLAFRMWERSSGRGRTVSTRISMYRLDRHGFQPANSFRDRETLFVPVTGSAWRPGQPIEVFYRCDVFCGFAVPEGSPLLPKEIVMSGHLHPSALPPFVKHTFERAGISVASPFYVLTDSEPNPQDREWLTGLAGFLSAGFLFALSLLYGAVKKNGQVKQSQSNPATEPARSIAPPPLPKEIVEPIAPLITLTVDRDSVAMGDDIEDHSRTLSIAPSRTALDLVSEALKVCPLPSRGTWSVSTLDGERRHKRWIGVLAEQWNRQPKLVVPAGETVASLFADGAVGLIFRYRAQSDPEADYQALRDTGRFPSPPAATKQPVEVGKAAFEWTDAAFTQFLVAQGLTSFGSDETLEDLRQRFGTRKAPGNWTADVVALPPVSLFPGQSDPFLLRWNPTCLIPPSSYECFLESGGDAVRTYYRAVTQLTDRFGIPETGTFGKLLSAFWKFQRKSLTVFTEQAENNGPTTCRVYIDRNWIPSLTQAEADLLSSLGPNQMMPVSNFSLFPTGDNWEAKPGAGFRYGDDIRGSVRGLYRLAPDGFGMPADAPPYLWKAKDVVGWRAGRWSVIFERKYLQRLELRQALAAKGSAYSALQLQMRNPFNPEHNDRYFNLFQGPDTNSLDDQAQELSRFWDLPLEIHQFENS